MVRVFGGWRVIGGGFRAAGVGLISLLSVGCGQQSDNDEQSHELHFSAKNELSGALFRFALIRNRFGSK